MDPQRTGASETRYNMVFMGNFLYPAGMAATKRIQHAIDYLLSRGDTDIRVLPLRQAHPGRERNRLTGTHRGVPYRTIGADVLPGWRLPWALAVFLFDGFRELYSARKKGSANILYLYNEPNLENILFVIGARTMGYRVICDIVEDRYLIDDSAGLLSRSKAYTASWSARHIRHLVHGIVVISSRLEAKFAALTTGRVPIVLIPVTVDLNQYRASVDAFHDPVRILYAGSFGEKDDVENLIAAFERVRSKGLRVVLWLTGKGMAARMKIVEKRIADSRYRDDMHYLGYLKDDEYFRVLCECDIPCMIRTDSDYSNSGFPFKLGEYLATGRPVIASGVGDVSKYLRDKQTAVLIPPESAERMADAIEYLVADPMNAMKIGRKGRSVAIDELDYRSAWSRLELLFTAQ